MVSANVGGALVSRPLVKPDPHSRNLRFHRLSDTSATFFITKSLLPKKAVLDEAAREIIVSAFAFAGGQQRIYLRAFVVMPDHWRALFALCEPWTLPKFMHHMMSYVGGKTTTLLKITKHRGRTATTRRASRPQNNSSLSLITLN